MSTMSKLNESATSRITVRFPQVDPAGNMFYPRYFEIAVRQFPDVPLTSPPFTLKTQFIKPNRLGDKIDLSLVHDSGSPSWLIVGRMNGEEHFSIRLFHDESELFADAHHPDLPAFKSDEGEIGEWAAGHNGRIILSRYFEFLNMAIEEWFEDSIKMPFHELHYGRSIGIPTVQFDTRIRNFPPTSSKVSMWLRPTKLGRRAMTFKSWFVVGGQYLVENEQAVVFVRIRDDGYESIPIPTYIRESFEKQLIKIEKGK